MTRALTVLCMQAATSVTREGWTFRREFEHASVFVDLEKRTAAVDWK